MKDHQNGNVLVYILIAIVLIGLLTVAMRDQGGSSGNVDNETTAVQVNNMLAYAAELQTAVNILLDKGVSEQDIRFAYPSANAAYGVITTNPQNQVFSSQGGKAVYRKVPASIGNGVSPPGWDFSSQRSLPEVGSNRDELYANALPLSDSFCRAINLKLGLSDSIPSISCGSAVQFAGVFSSSPTILNKAAFSRLPAPQFCMRCTNLNQNLFVTTLIAR